MTYDQLKADIVNWMIGEDVANVVPTFIALAEERHKWGIVGPDGRRYSDKGAVRVRDMGRRARRFGDGSPYISIPTDMLEHRRLQYVALTERDRQLDFVGSENMGFSAHWKPTKYTINRREFEFNGNLPTGSEIEILYYAPFTPLSDINPTNWLLQNCYGAYLYGALCEADTYTQDDERILLWENKYAQIVAGLMASEHRARRSQGQLRVKMSGRSTP